MPDEECHCSGAELVIFACSGGCNVGQLSNDAARYLVDKGIGKMGCVAAIAAGGPMAISSAKSAKNVVVIDGCPVQCARKVLMKVEIRPTITLLATDLGLMKTDSLGFEAEFLTKLVEVAREMIEERTRLDQP